MQKQAPTIGRILAMVVFALSCFGLLLFLWLSFGGPIPLKPQGYRFSANFSEAATLPVEADVRLAGVNVGRVKEKELDKGGAATRVTIELKPQYAPIPADTRAILRQKTLLGETYIELSAGSRKGPKLPDEGTLRRAQVEPAVQLDEILSVFDRRTRTALQDWVRESARSIKGGRGQDLSDALGNLRTFAESGAGVLETLDEQGQDVRRLVRNTGGVFRALGRRDHELRDLIVNSNRVFSATGSRNDALAETFDIFPTFLDESRATMTRLEGFSRDAHPVIRLLKDPAAKLGPTIHDLGELAPDLRQTFRKIDPLITTSKTDLPAAERVLRGAAPVLEGLHAFLPELNPILAFLNFNQQTVAGFTRNGSYGLMDTLPSYSDGLPRHYLRQYGVFNDASFTPPKPRAPNSRGYAYLQPNSLARWIPLGVFESFDCDNAGGEVPDATENNPPCFVAPPSLFQNQQFPRLERGKAPLVPPPKLFEGTKPAKP
jgi:phospholipid/cholesterol/gamma-HCH transport system substrate-binding protein